jgi:hypothetical protein
MCQKITPKVLMFLVLFSPLSIFAQVAVYDFSERATWTGQGETFRQIVVGKWILDLSSQRVVQITAYPANRTYFVYDYELPVVRAVGPKSRSYSIIANAWADSDIDIFASYDSLVGSDKPVRLGGVFGALSLPTALAGPTFTVYLSNDLGHQIRRGSRTLKINSGQTRGYNSRGATVDGAAAELIAAYQFRGFTLGQ